MSTTAVLKTRDTSLEQEFAGVFREHYQLLHRSAYSITGSKQDAEDVVQAVFLKLLQRGDRLDVRFNLKAYLYRAVVNEALSAMRTRKRHDLSDNIEDLQMTA